MGKIILFLNRSYVFRFSFPFGSATNPDKIRSSSLTPEFKRKAFSPPLIVGAKPTLKVLGVPNLSSFLSGALQSFPHPHFELVTFEEGPARALSALYKGRREEAENGVVLHGGLYGPPYELPVGQNVRHGFSGKVISIIH